MSRLRVDFPLVQRRARCTPLGMSIQSSSTMLDVFALSRLFWLRRFLRIPGIGRTATMVLPATQLLSNLQLCLLHRVVGDQGHRPKELFFFVLDLLRECELPGSCVHLPVWLMSQEFPETQSFSYQTAHKGRRPRTSRATLKDHHCGRVTRRDS